MVYYIGYYNCDQIRDEQRRVSPAAENKMRYIISALEVAVDDYVTVVSPANTKLHKLVKGQELSISNKVTLKTFPSISGSKLVRVLGYFLTNICFTMYLLKNVHGEDHLIVYHSLNYRNTIAAIKAIKKCKLTLEVEEIYNDVIQKSKSKRAKEVDFIRIADQYIFPTELLNGFLNKVGKTYTVVHGTYRGETDRKECFNDNKIHVVYAGTLDPRKGGAVAAKAAEFLSAKYHVHILGFGGAAEVDLICKTVKETQKKTTATVTYDGQLLGENYVRFIQKCHIGLSTQDPNADFNATSFPSKVLSYMSNGLRVVSVRIPAIETSDVGKYVYYYDLQTPAEIAQAIMSVDLTDDYDSRRVLDGLNQKFCNELRQLVWN